MKIYKVPVKYIFEGAYFIKANSKGEAAENAEKHCSLVMGGYIHSTLPDDDVDWDFACHPEKIIGMVQGPPDEPPLEE